MTGLQPIRDVAALVDAANLSEDEQQRVAELHLFESKVSTGVIITDDFAERVDHFWAQAGILQCLGEGPRSLQGLLEENFPIDYLKADLDALEAEGLIRWHGGAYHVTEDGEKALQEGDEYSLLGGQEGDEQEELRQVASV